MIEAPFRLDRFDYELPPELIAQHPTSGGRSESRLLVVDRANGTLSERPFEGIVELLRAGDLLIRNDTKVFPARLLGQRLPSGGQVEALLFEEIEAGLWRALMRPGKKLRVDSVVEFDGLRATVVTRPSTFEEAPLPGERWLRFAGSGDVRAHLAQHGLVPLPPYVHEALGDPARYQTVYAREAGAVAAPTAGFHFTEALFDRLRQRGVEVRDVTLHVGPGTFQPVKTDDYRDHVMHHESFEISAGTSAAVAQAKAQGRRVVAVGTTSLRVLESVARAGAIGHESRGKTDLFVTPGYRFAVVDALITNFHLPRTTLLLLVAAFAGEDLMRAAYGRAVADRFRFYSFGDAMFVTG